MHIITVYHDIHNQQKLTYNEQENGLKPHLGPFFGPNWPIFGPANFFSALGQPLGTRYRYSQSQYAKSPKTNDFLKKKMA